MVQFGDFQPLCSGTPSYTWCNLFYRQVCTQFAQICSLDLFACALQLQRASPSSLTGLSADSASAPIGIDPTCGILRIGHGGSLGNIPNIVACALSIFVIAALIVLCHRRKAAVGTYNFPSSCHPPPWARTAVWIFHPTMLPFTDIHLNTQAASNCKRSS